MSLSCNFSFYNLFVVSCFSSLVIANYTFFSYTEFLYFTQTDSYISVHVFNVVPIRYSLN